MDSILMSIKKLLGVDEYCDHFDQEIIIHINSVLTILNQLGVGPSEGFFITGSGEKWTDFVQDNKSIEFIKTYIYMKVRLLFDPPQSSATIESMNRLASELEWRIQVAVDPVKTDKKEEVVA